MSGFAEFSAMVNNTAILQLIGCTLASNARFWARDIVDLPSGKIINGQDANVGEFPYIIGITRKVDRLHFCGGTILTKSWVLTAAHCCDLGTPQCFNIYSGSVNEDSGGHNRIATRFIVHEQYNSTDSYKNDICLIRVFPPFILGVKLRQVILPQQDWPVPLRVKLIAAGWGFTKPHTFPNRVIPKRMRKLNMFAIDNEECDRVSPNVTFFPGYLCAYPESEGQGVCQGDSGGPLMFGNVQVGITSWVYLPCGISYPDFFVRLPLYIDWIKGKLGHEARELKFMN